MQLEKNGNWEEYPDYFKQIIIDPNKEIESNLLLQKVKVKPNTEAKIHYHKNQKEIFIVTKGKGYFIVDDKKINTEEGDVLKILPNEKHTVGNDNVDSFEFIAIKTKYQKEDTYTD